MLKQLITILLPLTFHCAFAWDAMGHRIIAAIAYDQLTPTAKAKSNELIDYLADAYPYNSSFQTASSWADFLRQDGVDTFDAWHFINQPFSDDGTPTHPAGATNIVWAINQCIAILQNPSSNQFEKAFFLRFLLHLVGDAHQPLHCANRFSADFPKGDQGGNLLLIKQDNYNNLHAYWDDGLGFFESSCNLSMTKSQQAKCLAEKIEQDYPESFFQQKANDLNPGDWAAESFTIAKDFVYQTPEYRSLSKSYQQQGQRIVEQQLALAGYRLANLLNLLFY